MLPLVPRSGAGAHKGTQGGDELGEGDEDGDEHPDVD